MTSDKRGMYEMMEALREDVAHNKFIDTRAMKTHIHTDSIYTNQFSGETVVRFSLDVHCALHVNSTDEKDINAAIDFEKDILVNSFIKNLNTPKEETK